MKINSLIYALAPVYFIVGEDDYIHYGGMTSYNL